LIGEHPWRSYLWQNLLHIQNYTGTPLAQMWSLAVEEHFYLALALLMPIWIKYSRKPATLACILVGLLIIPIALRAGAVAFDTDPLLVQTHTHFRLDSLAAGVLLAVLMVHYPQDFEKLLALRPVWMIVTVAGCTWLCHVPRSSNAGQIIGYSIAWITSAAFLLAVRHASFIERARAVSVPLAVLGTNAYALYIWHASCAGFVTQVSEHSVHLSPLLVIVAKYSLSIVVALAVSRAVERPGLVLRDRFFPRPARTDLPVEPTVLDLTTPSDDAKAIII
jgi:peptidoglycan/LPS O-acetylase OafA/YrhL